MQKLQGLGIALVTPFTPKGEIDYNGLLKLLQHTAKNGADYWVVMGSTGEAATLTDEEQKDVLSFVLENNIKNIPVIFGLGGNNTAALTKQLQAIDLSGVTAILSSSPAYNKPTQNGIIAHFEKLANQSPKPIIIYNVPGRTGSNMEASTTIKLAQHPNIIGIKEASGDLFQIMEIIHKTSDDFMVISGDDLLTPAICSIGGKGLISVVGNALPKEAKKMVEASLKGDYRSSRKAAFDLLAINALMYNEGNPTGVKALLMQLNICDNFVRLPLLPATAELQKKIAEAL